MVARLCPRHPVGRLLREQTGNLLPVVKVAIGNRLVPVRQARRVAHQVADLDLRLSVGSELRPVASHRRLEIQLAAVGEQKGYQGRHGLRGGVDVDDRIGLPGARTRFVGPTAPEINHRLAIHRRAEDWRPLHSRR